MLGRLNLTRIFTSSARESTWSSFRVFRSFASRAKSTGRSKDVRVEAIEICSMMRPTRAEGKVSRPYVN